jgi:hypothetical protein
MFESHRERYALAVIDRLHERSFEELALMAMDPVDPGRRERLIANAQALANRDQIEDKLTVLFLDKFYALPPMRRRVYLATFALMQLGQIEHPIKFNLPGAEEFLGRFSKFMTGSPRRQALVTQFLLDVKAQQKGLGIAQ